MDKLRLSSLLDVVGYLYSSVHDVGVRVVCDDIVVNDETVCCGIRRKIFPCRNFKTHIDHGRFNRFILSGAIDDK